MTKHHFVLCIILLFFNLDVKSQGGHCLLFKGDHIDTLNMISIRYFHSKKMDLKVFRSTIKIQAKDSGKVKLAVIQNFKDYTFSKEYFYYRGGLIDSTVFKLNYKKGYKINVKIAELFNAKYFYRVGNDFTFISKNPIKAMFSPEFLKNSSLSKHYILMKFDRHLEKEGSIVITLTPILLTPAQCIALKSERFKLED